MGNLFRSNWPLVLIILLSFLITWPIFVPGYFSHHDDLQVMRIFEMRKCFSDFQIPCRWVPDMGYGNGYPLFNYYAPLGYYLGAGVSYLFGYVGSAKFLFFLPLVLGGIGMYFLAKELFGKVSGFVGGILYLFAPYRALDAYVRGAVGEGFAISLIPIVFFFYLRLVTTNKPKYFLLSTITTGLFFMAHNIMTLLFAPLIFAWILLSCYQRKWSAIKPSLLSFILALGLSSFFILPAFFEKELVQTEALTRAELDFRAQFVKVSQLFVDRSWNYSGSQPMSDNTISYQIGWPHWWLVILSFFIAVYKKKRKYVLLFGFLFLIFTFGVYMTHNKSTLVWESIKILSFVQFPWRFLSVVIFAGSLIGAYFLTLFDKKWTNILAGIILVVTVVFNWQYFRPEHFYPEVTDSSKLSGQNFIDQQKGALLDYLPKTALEPRELPPKTPYLVSGVASVGDFINKSNLWRFNAKVDNEAAIEVPVFDFPGWEVFVNGEKTSHTNKNLLGRIGVVIPKGEFVVEGRFMNTPIRSLANMVSVLSLALLVWIGIYGKNKIFFK